MSIQPVRFVNGQTPLNEENLNSIVDLASDAKSTADRAMDMARVIMVVMGTPITWRDVGSSGVIWNRLASTGQTWAHLKVTGRLMLNSILSQQ